MPLKIKSALICDLARQEKGNKFILIGIYTGDIIFTKKPSHFRPTFWVEMFSPLRNSNLEIDAKINIPGRKDSIKIPINLAVEEEDTILLVFTVGPFEVTDDGFLKLNMRQKGRRTWTEVIAKPVRFVDPPLPSP